MLTKGAIGNLVNRYRAVLTKCNLINTFGSLAVAAMLVLGVASVAGATSLALNENTTLSTGIVCHDGYDSNNKEWDLKNYTLTIDSDAIYNNYNFEHAVKATGYAFTGTEGSSLIIKAGEGKTITYGLAFYGNVAVENLDITSKKNAIQSLIGQTIINASTINLNSFTSSGIHTEEGGSVLIEDAKNLNITAGEHAISAASETVDIKASNITLSAKATGIIAHNCKSVSITEFDNFSIIDANNGIINEGYGNVAVESTRQNSVINITALQNAIEHKKDGHKGSISIKANDINIESINGNGLYAEGHYDAQKQPVNITIDAANNLTFTASNPKKNAIYLRDNDHYITATITAGNDLLINGSVKLYNGKNNTIKGKNIIIQSENDKALEMYTAQANITANESISINSKGNYGIVVNSNYEGGSIIDAPQIDINTDGKTAILAQEGSPKIILNANQFNITGDIKSTGNGLVSIDDGNKYADGYVANVDGDITAGTGSTIKLDLGEGGSLTGAVNAADMDKDATTGVHLDFGKGSAWNATGASSVTNLEMNGATVDMSKTDGDIEVANLTGEGGDVIMDAAKTNKFNVENTSKNTAVKAVATQNADNVTKAQAAEMVNRLEGVQNKTAEVAGGLGKDGYTVTTDEEGNAVVSGGGASDVTKTVLQQASVTTVALDKLLTNDVRKRLGDIRSDKNTTGVWMRWDGGKLKGDAGLANNFNTIQIGGDTKAAKNCRIGFAGSFTHGDMDFNRGGGELEGFSFALYGTWMGENGMFADVVARLGKFSTEMNVEGNTGDMDNRVASLSAEYGWRFNLAQQFFVEPQVELAYTYVSSDDLQLGDVQYQFDSVDSLTGRAGVVFGWNLPDERGNVYARASVLQQFMGDAKITGYTNADPVIHETDGEDTWLEYGIGANVKLTDSTYLWADVERTEGADIEEEWRGTVGVRFSF